MGNLSAGPGSETESALIDEGVVDVEVRAIQHGINTEQYRDWWPPKRERIGICCSGGGIRSASFSLGALQVFRSRGLLDRAEYMSAVSGGAYMAIAHAALVGLTLQDQNANPTPDPFADLPPWAPHSPEEKNLRDHSTYLAAGSGGKVWLLLNVIYGVVRQLLPFGAAIFAFGFFVGWLYEPWLKDGLSSNQSPDFSAPLRAVLGVLGTGALVLLFRQGYQQKDEPDGAFLHRLRSGTMNLLWLGVLVAAFGLLIPNVIILIDDPPDFLDWASVEWLLGLELGGLAFTGILGWLAKKGRFARLIPILVPLLAPLVVGLPFVFAVMYGVQEGPDGKALYWWLGSLLTLVIVWISLDLVTPSMHLFYRERLATVFIGLRQRVGGKLRFAQPPWRKPVRLSSIRRSGHWGVRLPKLVVCAAVNVTEEVPPGRLAATFTFERDRSGGPLTGYVKTKRIEEASELSRLTLPAMMAISGAAVSPSMGKATRASYRLLLALFNVRLGVWIPNPQRLDECWHIEHGPDGKKGVSLRWARLKRKARRPGVSYLLSEALGINNLKRPYIYVSDGGHWDNLGLVELLRRGCMQIICLDASGDPAGRYDTMGEAIALARSELGVEITIDCQPLSPIGENEKGDHPDYSPASHVVGKVEYPNGAQGILIFAKTVLTRGIQLDVRSYHEKDKKFPRHSTGDQLFDDQQLESYRALGGYIGRDVMQTLNRIRIYNGMDPVAP